MKPLHSVDLRILKLEGASDRKAQVLNLRDPDSCMMTVIKYVSDGLIIRSDDRFFTCHVDLKTHKPHSITYHSNDVLFVINNRHVFIEEHIKPPRKEGDSAEALMKRALKGITRFLLYDSATKTSTVLEKESVG